MVKWVIGEIETPYKQLVFMTSFRGETINVRGLEQTLRFTLSFDNHKGSVKIDRTIIVSYSARYCPII